MRYAVVRSSDRLVPVIVLGSIFYVQHSVVRARWADAAVVSGPFRRKDPRFVLLPIEHRGPPQAWFDYQLRVIRGELKPSQPNKPRGDQLGRETEDSHGLRRCSGRQAV